VNVDQLLDVVRPAARHHPNRRPQAPAGRPGHAPRVPFALLVTVLIAGGMGLLLLLNTASAANEVRRHDLSARDAMVAAQVQELHNEVAASAAPGNLARAAAELGMVPGANPAFLVVGADGTVRVLGRPAPASDVHVVQQPAKRKKKKAATPTRTTTGTAAATTTAGRAGPAAKTSPAQPSGTAHTSAHLSPTPTPTPTLTLPGGNR
jgi:hypothetical protein